MDTSFSVPIAFGWSILAGFIMSMGGGGGGILAGVGHISVLEIADANMIKVVNQILEVASRIVSVPLYFRQKRLVWSLALTFGIGAPVGAVVGSWFSKNFLSDMTAYRTAFGLLVTLVAARMIYEGWYKLPAHRVSTNTTHPHTVHIGWRTAKVRFGDEDISFRPWSAALGGFAISFVGSTLGVGGGFLVTPFMVTILLFPMFLVVGTSLVALMIPLTASVITYLTLQVNVDWMLVAVEVPGIMIGSFLGPVLNRYMNEKALKTFVAAVLLGIGIHYFIA